MINRKNQSAVLAKYFSMYEKNPRSKVFAPLAESYRKLGMLDDAFKVLKEGIRIHPTYALGYIVLAHCYFDQEKFELTYNTLRPIVAQNADNISLQKIFAKSCIELGYLEEALETYKYLLFMNPQDKFFQAEVRKLEDDLHVGHKKLSLDQIVSAPNYQGVNEAEINEDDWQQVDFNKPTSLAAPEDIQAIVHDQLDDEESWVMESPLSNREEVSQQPAEEIIKTESIQVPTELKNRSLDDDFYADEFQDEFGEIDEANDEGISQDAPIISHTLIDLYISQKYFTKAQELLEKTLLLNPDDAATIDKLQKVKALQLETTEDEGHEELISIIENQVKTPAINVQAVEKSFNLFLDAIKERSQQLR